MAISLHALKSTAAMRSFAAGIRANVPVLFTGQPGEGKSAKIDAYGTGWQYFVKCVVGSNRESSDFLGLPTEDPTTGTTSYLPPKFAYEINENPGPSGSLLFLGELRTSDPSVQKAMLRLVQERWAGDLKLADHVRIVADANPTETSADGYDLAAPVANRFMHLDWHFDVDEWLTGVLDDFSSQRVYSLDEMLNKATASDLARAKGLVTGFLKSSAGVGHLNPGPPKDEAKAGKAWASPRSWTNAMNVLGHLRPEDDGAMFLVVEGCVGSDLATAFIQYIETADLWDPAEVLANPGIVNWSGERPDRLFALTMGIEAYAKARAEDPDVFQAALAALTVCAEHRKADVAQPSVRSLLNRLPRGEKIPQATRAAFTDLFERTGAFHTAA